MAEEKAKKTMSPAVKQWIIPIAVLVVICLVCGALLALCNDLLYIDDATRLSRSMQKVYKDFDLDKELKVESVTAPYGKVNKVYLSKDGTYVIEALGVGGYQGGTVTLYVVIGADAKIKGWAVKENDKQSYIDRVPSSAGTTWYVGKEVSDELPLVMTGATVVATSTAINNAVNMAAYYARTVLKLGKNPVAEATNAIEALMAEKQISGYTFINSSSTVSNISVGDAKLSEYLTNGTDVWSYTFIGWADDGSSIAVHLYNWDANYQFDTLEGVPATTKVVAVKVNEVVASLNVTDGDELLNKATTYPLYRVGNNAMYAYVDKVDGAVYTVVGVKVSSYVPNNYSLVITIKTNDDGVGEVESITIDGNGWVDGIPQADANKLATSLVGATLATVDSIYSSDKVAGATQSANIIAAAVKAALTQYDASLASSND